MKTLLIILALALPSCTYMDEHPRLASTGGVVARRAAEIAFNTVLTFATSPQDETKKQDYLDGLAVAFRSNIGNVLTSGDVKKLVSEWTPDKPHWQELSEKFGAEWDRLKPATAKESAMFAEAFAAGLNLTRTAEGKLILATEVEP